MVNISISASTLLLIRFLVFFGSNIPVSYALCFLCVSVCESVCVSVCVLVFLCARNNRTRARLKLN